MGSQIAFWLVKFWVSLGTLLSGKTEHLIFLG
jgi:hypothetical protein